MREEQVILVNEQDQEIGLMSKMEAHEKAVLHRAFSVFIFNSKNVINVATTCYSFKRCFCL